MITPDSERPIAALGTARQRLISVSRLLVLAGGLAYLALLAVLIALRVRYPFELEWLEGAMVDHVRVILDGRPLYGRPTIEFIPLTYTPGYVYAAALLSKVMGVGFLPLRLISIASTAGLLVLVGAIVGRATGDRHAAVLSAGLAASMYGRTSGWYDLARNDALFLCLALLAVYLLRRASLAAALSAGVLISLSFLTKQTGLIVAVPLACWCALRSWRVFAAFVAPVVVIVAGSTIWFEHVFDGWYLYYVYAVPKQHPVAREALVGFWRYDVFGVLPLACLGAAAYLASAWRSRDRLFYAFAAAGLFGGAWASRLHSLSFVNVVLPAYVATAILFGLAKHDLTRRASTIASPRARMASLLALEGACLVQLAMVIYAPGRLVPTAADVAAGQEFVRRLAAVPEPVFVPFHGYLPSLAGKKTFAHAVVLGDTVRGGTTGVESSLAAELRSALEGGGFLSVVKTDSRTPMDEWLGIEPAWAPATELTSRRSPFWRPEWLYVRR
ncbi:MAG: glycosyltransferase family 39 protein [Acidobacteria bacterium]|nr:glycosyltransferase family 39 protein [Acidobacteriota bacterium]